MCNMLVPGSLLYESCECRIFFMGYASTNILMNVVGWGYMDAWSGYLSYPLGWPHCGCGAVKLLCESLAVILFSQFRNVFCSVCAIDYDLCQTIDSNAVLGIVKV